MTQTIHKFTLNIADEQDVIMPEGAHILTVQVQNGEICLWAKVITTNPAEARKILIRGTGHDAADVGRYIATVQMAGGGLIWHLFEAAKGGH